MVDAIGGARARLMVNEQVPGLGLHRIYSKSICKYNYNILGFLTNNVRDSFNREFCSYVFDQNCHRPSVLS